MWRRIKKILSKAPKKLLKFRSGFSQPTSAPAGPNTEDGVPHESQNHGLQTPEPSRKYALDLPSPTLYPHLPTNEDTPFYSCLSQSNLIDPSKNSPHPLAPSIPDVLTVVDVEDEEEGDGSASNPKRELWETAGSGGLPDYFLRRSRCDASLPRRSQKNHIFDPVYANLPMTAEDAVAISERRKRGIRENTVFEAPQNWHEWKTRRGKRIVSSEPVRTIVCKRTGNTSFIGSLIGLRYAIFDPSNGHLMDFESLGDWHCPS